MKTSELKKIVKENGLNLKVYDHVYMIYKKDLYLCSVGRDNNYVYLDYPCPKNIAQAILDYAYTPLEEREEENKYLLKMPEPFGSAFHQVFVNLVGDRYIISTNENTESYKSVFTQQEIDAMPFDTNFFIKEEVK